MNDDFGLNAAQILAYVAAKWPNAMQSELAQATHAASALALLESSDADAAILGAESIATNPTGDMKMRPEFLHINSGDTIMKVATVTNSAGRVFNVRRIESGERYGRTQSIKAENTIIEFYDARYADFGPLGQFISRYFLSTLSAHEGDLCLDGGHSAWCIDAKALHEALTATESL